jgi:hypothetical protein
MERLFREMDEVEVELDTHISRLNELIEQLLEQCDEFSYDVGSRQQCEVYAELAYALKPDDVLSVIEVAEEFHSTLAELDKRAIDLQFLAHSESSSSLGTAKECIASLRQRIGACAVAINRVRYYFQLTSPAAEVDERFRRILESYLPGDSALTSAIEFADRWVEKIDSHYMALAATLSNQEQALRDERQWQARHSQLQEIANGLQGVTRTIAGTDEYLWDESIRPNLERLLMLVERSSALVSAPIGPLNAWTLRDISIQAHDALRQVGSLRQRWREGQNLVWKLASAAKYLAAVTESLRQQIPPVSSFPAFCKAKVLNVVHTGETLILHAEIMELAGEQRSLQIFGLDHAGLPITATKYQSETVFAVGEWVSASLSYSVSAPVSFRFQFS